MVGKVEGGRKVWPRLVHANACQRDVDVRLRSAHGGDRGDVADAGDIFDPDRRAPGFIVLTAIGNETGATVGTIAVRVGIGRLAARPVVPWNSTRLNSSP